MERRNPYLDEIKYLQEEKEELSEELNNTKDELTYYKNRCIFLQNIIKKFKAGIKRLIN